LGKKPNNKDKLRSIREAGIAPGQKPASSNWWILNSWRDLFLFVATPALIIPLVAGARSRFSIEDIAACVAAFGAIGHHLPGMLRAYGDRELFQRFKVRFVVSPLFLSAVCVLFARLRLTGLTVVLLLWGVWHGLAQVYGFARIYDAKMLSFAPVTAKLDWLMCVAWFGAGLLYSPGRMAALLDFFYQSGGPLLSASQLHAVQDGWGLATVAVSLAFLGNAVWRWTQGQRPNPVKFLLMTSSFGFWWYAMVGINNALLGIALFEIFHDAQYLSIVWVYNRKRVDQGRGVGAFTRFLFRRSWTMVGLYVGLVFAYGYIKFLAEIIDRETLQQSLFGILSASTFLHFYYDGFIWKVREQSTRQSLGLEGGQAAIKALPRFTGLQHSLRWSLFVVPLCVLGISQWQGAAPRLDQYRSLAAAVPDSWYSHNKLAMELQARGETRQALEHFRQALQLNPDDPELRNKVGSTLSTLGDQEEAMEHFRRALELRSSYAEAHANLGSALLAQQKVPEAISSYRRALELKPDSAAAHNNLGTALSAQGHFEQALNHFRRAYELDPSDAATHHYNVALTRHAQGDLEEAIRLYRKVLQIDPQHVAARTNLANAFSDRGSTDEAVSQYREVLQHQPNSLEALNNLGAALNAQGKHEEAMQQFHRALEASPGYYAAHNNLGITLNLLGKYTEAMPHFRQALQSKADWPAPLSGLASILASHPDAKLRDPIQAIQLAGRASELTQYRDPSILGVLATAHAAAGQWEQAAAVVKTALALASEARDDRLANQLREQLRLYSRTTAPRNARSERRP
jgi:tetratricopeptide (TPR) repeat protein